MRPLFTSNRPGRKALRTRSVPTLFTTVLLALLIGVELRAETVEWSISSELLRDQISSALGRYLFTVRNDTASVRYLETYSESELEVEVRAEVPPGTALSRILLVRVGQVQLHDSRAIRRALGEELYRTTLKSRERAREDDELIALGEPHGARDWTGDHTITIALLDRVDVSASTHLNIFAQLGAPESGRDFWSDGTGRIGLSAPVGEFGLLFPIGFGSVGAGPIAERRLSPSVGASAFFVSGSVEGRLRVSAPYQGSLVSTRSISDVFVPYLSAGVTSRLLHPVSALGDLEVTAGVGYEEVVKVFDGGPRGIVRSGSFRRVAPLVNLVARNANQTLRVAVGTQNFSLRTVTTLRLTTSLWFEVRTIQNNIFRESDPFESDFRLFFTPRIKF